MTAGNTPEREIVISRLVNASRELVWEAWTNPKHLVHWWGPEGFSTTIHEMDFRPGGAWKQTMHGPDGTNYQSQSVFMEIAKPERVVYKHGGRQEDGPGTTFTAVWTFEAQGAQTKVTGTLIFPSKEVRDQTLKNFKADEGGKQTLGRLDHYLKNMPASVETKEFVISRVFDAPQELAWKALTEPERMKEWSGPKDFTLKISKMDFRPGGIYHYCMVSPEGNEMWGKVVYQEIVPPRRLVFLNSFSDEKGGLIQHPFSRDPWPLEMLSTFTLSEENGKTIFTVRWAPYRASSEERETFQKGFASMTQGWTGTLDQLTNYLRNATV